MPREAAVSAVSLPEKIDGLKRFAEDAALGGNLAGMRPDDVDRVRHQYDLSRRVTGKAFALVAPEVRFAVEMEDDSVSVGAVGKSVDQASQLFRPCMGKDGIGESHATVSGAGRRSFPSTSPIRPVNSRNRG